MTLKLKKSERGWNNEYTARLLCPQTMLPQFEADWRIFTQKVKQGEIELCEYHLPSFLWDQTVADPNDITVGLFRGPLLVSCFRNIFTGPRTGDSDETGMQPGKSCFIQMYNIASVIPIMIGYIAILIRFALNSQRAWKVQDGDFKADECLKYMLGLFGSEEEEGKVWATQTIEWWNLQVLSVKPHEFRVPIEESAVAMIHAVFARKSRKA
ncbi:hypothetical protein QCA50_015550 [Cerrena zonata]|uniref:Uncharacterized protein n=1 Tax=Cerrena zonata TaxID=2478898 RepID=A0AAW0FIC2_9APHY